MQPNDRTVESAKSVMMDVIIEIKSKKQILDINHSRFLNESFNTHLIFIEIQFTHYNECSICAEWLLLRISFLRVRMVPLARVGSLKD